MTDKPHHAQLTPFFHSLQGSMLQPDKGPSVPSWVHNQPHLCVSDMTSFLGYITWGHLFDLQGSSTRLSSLTALVQKRKLRHRETEGPQLI